MTAGPSPFPEALRAIDAAPPLAGLRWLIAGEGPACDEMERAVLDGLDPVWVTRVGDPLAALGELARTPADVVAIAAESPIAVAEEAHALRQLVPDARLLLVRAGSPDDLVEAAAAWNGAVASPVTADAVRRAFGGETPHPTPTDDDAPAPRDAADAPAVDASPDASTAEDFPSNGHPSAVSNGLHGDDEDARGAATSNPAASAELAKPADPEPRPRTGSLRRRSEMPEHQLDQFGRLRGPAPASDAAANGAPPANAAARDALDEPAPAPGAPVAEDAAPDADPGDDPAAELEADPGDDPGDVGDIDLITAVLAGRGVRDPALDVVRSRSGLPGVFLADLTAGVPKGHLGERVTFKGRDFGLLCAPADACGLAPPAASTTLDQLAAWAQWIAHWLALDEQMSLLKDMSMRDALTGVWNRRYFDRFLHRILDWATRERSQVTLLVFDIDDFKTYNDRYGHAAGDEILQESSKLMLSVVREHDVVARVGGDEFAVIFWDADPHPRNSRNPRNPRSPNARHPDDVVAAARRFQKAILEHNFPKLLSEAPGTLTISGGLASFPWDGRTPEELLDKADQMALQSKRAGKNAIMFGPGAERAFQMKRE